MTLFAKSMFTQASNFLCTRTCLASFCQTVSKNTLKSSREDIFPARPKKPATPFFMFIQHLREKCKVENPLMKQSDIVRKASKAWGELDPSEKEPYVNEYNQKHRTYSEQLRQFENSITDEQKQLLKQRKKEHAGTSQAMDNKKRMKVLGKPKRPAAAFIMYAVSRKHEKEQNVLLPTWILSVTDSWNSLPTDQKETFLTESRARQTQYTKDLLAWEMKMIKLGYRDVVRRSTLRKYKSGQILQSEET